ncbi:LPXTG cell wall anchor domain-containing protein [Enterococcus faecalis]|nr:LPXTG cell wall anchor domain-containing protein [Enterococcus faecalis]EGO5066726.1 LPXTG cell wall anchor domain-containing protein [Enterococcus faecalis]EGO5077193.1 LPXTG cell wall anchor domain-containing protein [Enterococcus faecalis]
MKKWCLGLILSSICLLGYSTDTLAVENESQETEVNVLLKRVIIPENSLPGIEITDTYKTNQNQINNQSKVKSYSLPSKAYPKTNEKPGIIYTIIGIAVVGLTGAKIIVKKREETEVNKDVSASS